MSFLLEKPFEFLVSTFGQYVVDTWRQGSHIERHLDNLQGALSRGHELIRRSECWRLRYGDIDRDLPRFKDALYEAESVVDELNYQRLKHEVENSKVGKLNDSFKNWMKGFPGRVEEAEENLSKFCNKMEEICNKLKIPENHNQFSETARPITTRFGNTSNFCGRHKELIDVIRLLGVPGFRVKKRTRKNNMSAIGGSNSSIQKKGNIGIVSIVGMGGVGKTTLAQMVYTDVKVKSYFKNLIWICISENFDVERLIKEIIAQVTKRSCHHTTLSSLQDTLQSTLKSMSFLLVLDDAWSENEMDWQRLLGPMRGGLKKGTILLTTRSQKISKIAGKCVNMESILYNLEGLEKNIYWDFFKSCAFNLDVTKESNPKLENIGRQICEKLKGSPLAAKTIGGLLKTNLDVGHWSSIRDSKIWQLNQEEHDILPVLQLSYQYLSSDLKRCFSFCSLYPRDYKFTKKELFNFWMMHGFINSQENSQQARDVLAGVYFDLLEERCFFQKAEESNKEEHVIHDLLHDVCQSITKDECFCIEHKNLKEKVPADIRHLSVYRLNWEKQNELTKYSKLLSLSVTSLSTFCTTSMEIWCNKLTNIQCLSLVKCNIGKLPKSIGNLKHLQYLDVSGSKITELPDSFCSLYSLKYLNMRGCECYCSFPEGSEKLVSLQIFYYPRKGMPLDGSVMSLAKTIVADCSELTTHGIIQNLRHINIQGSLSIKDLEVVSSKEAAEEAELKKKPLINDLSLFWAPRRSEINEKKEMEVLEGLCPYPDLKSLSIHFYEGVTLAPNWLKQEVLPNLTSFTIYGCARELTIGQLPHCITKLRIERCYCYKQINLDNCLRPENLPLLKVLEVSNCDGLILLPVESFGGFLSLEELTIAVAPKVSCSNPMVLPPSLKILYLNDCGDLEKSIPTSLQNLSLLESLRLYWCKNLVSIPVEAASSLKSLSSLEVGSCKELQSLGGLQFLASVKKLDIWSCPKLEETGGRDIEGKLPSEILANLPSSSQNRRRRARSASN